MHYKARSTEEGKKLTAMDGLRVVATLAALPPVGRGPGVGPRRGGGSPGAAVSPS